MYEFLPVDFVVVQGNGKMYDLSLLIFAVV